MAGKDIIMASQRELKQLHVVQKAIEGELKQTEAAEMLSLSIRQTGRIINRVKEEGPQGVVHRISGAGIKQETAPRGQRSGAGTIPAALHRVWAYSGPGEAS